MGERKRKCRHRKTKPGPRVTMQWGTGPTEICVECGATRNTLHVPAPWRADKVDGNE